MMPLLLSILLLPSVALADPLVSNGQAVAFLGDSITERGWSQPAGYVRLVDAGLATSGVRIRVLPAGVDGEQSERMLARSDGVLAQRPRWLVLSVGVNDVYLGPEGGVSLEKFKSNVSEIVKRALAARVSVMIITATPITENEGDPRNQQLARYNDALRAIARVNGSQLADANAAFWNAIKAGGSGTDPSGRVVTADGVHPNATGNVLLASAVLRAFGLDDAQVAKAQDTWLDIPGAVVMPLRYQKPGRREAKGSCQLTVREWRGLSAALRAKGTTVDAWTKATFAEEVEKLLAAGGPMSQPNMAAGLQREAEKKFKGRVDGELAAQKAPVL